MVKITLNINNSEITLTMDEARALFNDLKQIFDPAPSFPLNTPIPRTPGDIGYPIDHQKRWPNPGDIID